MCVLEVTNGINYKYYRNKLNLLKIMLAMGRVPFYNFKTSFPMPSLYPCLSFRCPVDDKKMSRHILFLRSEYE